MANDFIEHLEKLKDYMKKPRPVNHQTVIGSYETVQFIQQAIGCKCKIVLLYETTLGDKVYTIEPKPHVDQKATK